MNKSISYIAGALAVIAVVISLNVEGTPGKSIMGGQGPQGPKGDRGEQGIPGKDGVTRVVTTPSNSALGAVTGPDSYFPFYNRNGMVDAPRSVKFNQATTTICSIQAPNSTSTLFFASVQFTVSSTSASIVDIAKASNTGATTTKIGTTYSIAANAQATIVASTTATAGDATIFAPNQWLVVNQKGGATNVFSPQGQCTADFNIN